MQYWYYRVLDILGEVIRFAYSTYNYRKYRQISNRTVDPIKRKKFNFEIFVNPIMRKAAPLIINNNKAIKFIRITPGGNVTIKIK